jgi:hypothetical protein
MALHFDAATAAVVSAVCSMIYAVIAGVSLWLLSRQIRDARRFGAAPALYALLKEMEDHMAAVRQLGDRGAEDPEARETIARCLEFFERIEHLRNAGVLPIPALRPAFGGVLRGYLKDRRFADMIAANPDFYAEVLTLADLLGAR